MFSGRQLVTYMVLNRAFLLFFTKIDVLQESGIQELSRSVSYRGIANERDEKKKRPLPCRSRLEKPANPAGRFSLGPQDPTLCPRKIEM